MRDWDGKTYWIVGASEGLGAAIARALSRIGVKLILSARSEDRLAELIETLPGPARSVHIDVSDPDSVAGAALSAGEIDGVIYVAGTYWPMTAQEWDQDRVETMLDVNLLGATRVLSYVLPRFLERKSGHILLTGSLVGSRGLPGAIGYGASKAALISLAETMRVDLDGSGVDVQLVNPGFIKTRLTDKNDFKMPFIMEPDDAARKVVEHMNSDNFRRDFPGRLAAMIRFGGLLPDGVYSSLLGGGKS